MPGYPRILYDSSDTELYKTNLYESGTDPDVDGTERFTGNIPLTTKFGARLNIKYLGSNATDKLIVNVYERQDTTWTGNEKGTRYVFDNPGTVKEEKLVIQENVDGAGNYRVGMVRDGSSTTFDVHIEMRQWEYIIEDTL